MRPVLRPAPAPPAEVRSGSILGYTNILEFQIFGGLTSGLKHLYFQRVIQNE